MAGGQRVVKPERACFPNSVHIDPHFPSVLQIIILHTCSVEGQCFWDVSEMKNGGQRLTGQCCADFGNVYVGRQSV